MANKDVPLADLGSILEMSKQKLDAKGHKALTDLAAKVDKGEADLEVTDVPLFEHVFGQMFSDDSECRGGAIRIMGALKEAPKTLDVPDALGAKLKNGPYHAWMMAEIAKANQESLKVWQHTIRLIGSAVHSSKGTPLLNSLMGIAEKGFKSDDVSIRRETFTSWEVLINNFAKNEAVLNNNKRIKLLTRPLVANNNMNKEPLAAAKFHTFWHLILKLGINANSHMSTVIEPFLQFCYGKSPQIVPGKNQVPTSPVKKFGSLSSKSLDAFTHLLGLKEEGESILEPLAIAEPLFDAKTISSTFPTLAHSINEAFAHVNMSNRSDMAKLTKIFQTVSALVHTLDASAGKAEELKVISDFLVLTKDLSARGAGLSRVQTFVLTVLEEVSKLPANVLCSEESWTISSQPMEEFLQTMLSRQLISIPASNGDASLKKQYNSIFQQFLKKGCISKTKTLLLLEQVMTKLENATEFSLHCSSFDLIPLWKTVAGFLKDHIDRHQEVNQKDSTIEHSLGACEKILSYALKSFSEDASRGLWRQWNDLYRQVSSSAALVLSYTALELETAICRSMSRRIIRNPSLVSANNFCKVLNSVILSDIPFKSLGDEPQIVEKMSPVTALIANLIRTLPKFRSEKDSAEFALGLCQTVSTLATTSSSQAVYRALMEQLLPSVGLLMNAELLKELGKTYEDAADQMHNNVLNLVQSKYTGAFTKDLCLDLRPFLEATMGHPSRSIKSKSHQMWQVTFASSSMAVADIPSSISAILRKSLFLSSESSQSTMSSEGDSAPPTTFGSFLNRKEDEKASTPSKDKKKPAEDSPFKNFKLPSKANATTPTTKNKKVSLEDESSQDFVPITNSGKKKKRPLTDHQKDVLTKRREDIPALYSELSRDDSQMGLPAQFSSQLSQDESSQMAMDTDAFKAQAEKKDEETPKEDEAGDSQEVAESSEEMVQASESIVSEGSSRKRKGRPPIKNLPPVTKRQQDSDTPTKKKRGRPSKATTEAVGSKDEKSSKTSIRGVQVQPSEVKLNRLSPTQDFLVKRSPVKVVRENPLVLTPADEEDPKKAAKEVSRGLNFDADDDVIESSQQINQEASGTQTTTRGRKRKRDTSSTVTLTDKSQNSKVEETESKKSEEKPRRTSSRTVADKENLTSALMTPTTPSSQPTAKGPKGNKNKYGESPLHLAVKKGDLSKVSALLEKGVEVNARDNAGWTPIHESIRETPQAAEIIQALIDNGANVNIQADDGNTPLHDAVLYMPEKIIKVLVDNGGDCNIANKAGQTPLMIAAVPKVKELLKGGSPTKSAESPAKKALESPRKTMVSPEKSRSESPSKSGSEDKKESSTKEAESMQNGEHIPEENNDTNIPNGMPEDNQTGEEKTDEIPSSAAKPQEESQKKQIPESMDVEEEPSSVSLALPAVSTLSSATIRSPLPFTKITEKTAKRANSLMGSRGARLLEMSKNKGHKTDDNGTVSSVSASPSLSASTPLMSPKVSANPSGDVPSTPTTSKRQPWEKYQPSPSDASPSAGILKKSFSESDRSNTDTPTPPPTKRRRVQFKEPCVSDKVEIPRAPYGGSKSIVRQKLATTRFAKEIPLLKTLSMDEGTGKQQDSEEPASMGLYESTPPVDAKSQDMIYPALVSCDEPVTSILSYLANLAWQKACEKSLTENGVTRISDLCKLTPLKASSLKGLKPPDNVGTIKEALKKYEKKREGRIEKKKEAEISKKIAPVVDVSTPEEDERTIQQLYERPSPSPTEQLEEPKAAEPGTKTSPVPVEEATETSKQAEPETPLTNGEVSEKEAMDVDEPNIPTIVQAYQDTPVTFISTPAVQSPKSSPHKKRALRVETQPSPLVETSPTKRRSTRSDAAAPAESPKKKPAEESKASQDCGSQATPEKVPTSETGAMTEKADTKNSTVQAVVKTKSSHVQTAKKSQTQIMEDVMEGLDKLDPKQVFEVMQKCVASLKKEF